VHFVAVLINTLILL